MDTTSPGLVLIGSSRPWPSSSPSSNFNLLCNDSALFPITSARSPSLSSSTWLEKIEAACSTSHFNLLHLNINSVEGLEKMEGLSKLLNMGKLDLVSIQESKLLPGPLNGCFCFPEYEVLRRDRDVSGGGGGGNGSGGLLVFVKRSHKLVGAPYYDPVFETISFGLLVGRERVNFICSYNPHFQYRVDHLPHLEAMIQRCKGSAKTFVIGDLNQNLLTSNGDQLKSLMNSYNFTSLVSSPTHLQGKTPTSIDCVFTNDIDMVDLENTQVVDCPFSNHSFVQSVLKLRVEPFVARTIYARALNDKAIDRIIEILKASLHQFDILDLFEEVDDKIFAFTRVLMEVIDSVAPLKKFRLKKLPKLPWVDQEMIRLLAKRDVAHQIAVESKTERESAEWMIFKELRNHCKSMLRSKMKEYFADKSPAFFGSTKKYFEFYSTVVKTKKSTGSASISSIKGVDGVELHEDQQIADEFNKFFGSFSLPKDVSDDDSEKFVNDRFRELKAKNKIPSHRFSFHGVSSDTTLKFLKEIDSSSSPGNGDVSAKVLKACAAIIAEPLTRIFNASIAKAQVSNDWKFAIVTPLFKGKGANDNCDNYRGISVLQPIAKVFEHVLAEQIVTFFVTFGLFCSQQHGFRSGHSCETALHSILDKWKCSISLKKIIIALFIDFKKAFDLINPKLLFLKLFHYGFDNAALALVRSYFADRKQVTKVGKVKSNQLPIEIGVPQGSVLGPLFFLIFINDLPLFCELDSVLFADDTTVFDSGDEMESLVSSFKRKLEELIGWVRFNQMTINWSKTKVMFLTLKKRVKTPGSVTIEGNDVEVVKSFKLLGVIIDKDLNFRAHIEALKKTVNRKLYSYKKLFYLSFSTKVQFFKTFILPHFDYCFSLFIYYRKNVIDSLVKFFNVCLFRLFKLKLFSSSLEEQICLLEKFGILPLRLRFFYRISFLIYKIMNGKQLTAFRVRPVVNEYKARLRRTELLSVPSETTVFGSHRLSIFLPRFVNSVLKSSYQLELPQFKQFLRDNFFVLFNNFISENFFKDDYDSNLIIKNVKLKVQRW